MSASPRHDFPALCVELGLNCEACTEASARQLSASCPGLPGKLVSQLFVQIHVYPACSRMRKELRPRVYGGGDGLMCN